MIKKIVNYQNEEGFFFHFEPIEDTLKIKALPAGGYEARYLIRDDIAQSPDDDGDDGLFLVGYHRDFEVRRDKIITKETAQEIARLGFIPKKPKANADHYQAAEELGLKYHFFPLEAYIHSGVRLALAGEGNFPDRQWDVSLLGLVLASKTEWKRRDNARKAALGRIDTWNEYLSGDVYCLVRETYDQDKKQKDYDTCGGFYGSKYALEELEKFC